MNMIYEKHFRHLNFNTEQAIIVIGVTVSLKNVPIYLRLYYMRNMTARNSDTDCNVK